MIKGVSKCLEGEGDSHVLSSVSKVFKSFHHYHPIFVPLVPPDLSLRPTTTSAAATITATITIII